MFLPLVLLDMLAERTVAQLHIGELILILDEETAAVFAHRDRHIRDHVLEIALCKIFAEVGHILHKDLLKSHASHHILTDNDGLIVLWCDLMIRVLEQALSEKVIFEALISIVH